MMRNWEDEKDSLNALHRHQDEHQIVDLFVCVCVFQNITFFPQLCMCMFRNAKALYNIGNWSLDFPCTTNLR